MFEENVDKRTYAMKDSELLRRLLTYSKPYWLQFILIFALLFVASYAITEQPLYIGQALDIVSETGFDFNLILNIVYRLIIVVVIYNVFTYINTIMLQRIGQSIIYSIREEIFTHLEHHDIAYLNSSPTGSFVTRVTNDTNILNEMFTSVIVNVIGSLFVIC